MDVYAENILDHYRHPRHKGSGEKESVSHTEKNISCGDEITVHLTINNNQLQTIQWEGEGCAVSQAGMSIFAEEFEGKAVNDIAKLRKEDMYTLLGVPIGPRRFKCALICLHTVKNALRKYRGEKPQSWLETVEIDQK